MGLERFDRTSLRLIKLLLEKVPDAVIPIRVNFSETVDESFHLAEEKEEKGISLAEALGLKSDFMDVMTEVHNITKKFKVASFEIPVREIKTAVNKLTSIIEPKSIISVDREVFPALNISKGIINAPAFYDNGYTGKRIKVAILDTGVDGSHPDLSVTASYNFSMTKNKEDTSGHGTHVAGIVAGRGIENSRLSGIAPDAEIISIKVLPGYTSDIAAGIERAIELKADVMNLSLGGPCTKNATARDDYLAVSEASRLGFACVIAAGNEGPKSGTVGSPGCNPDAITVGAVNKEKVITQYSSRGPINGIVKPDILAPGGGDYGCSEKSGIISTKSKYDDEAYFYDCVIDDYYKYASGTSMATPHVTGAIALILQALREEGLTSTSNRQSELQTLKTLIYATADDLGYYKYEQGYGLINLENIFKRIDSRNLPDRVTPLSAGVSNTDVSFPCYPENVVYSVATIAKVYELNGMGKIGRYIIKAIHNGAGAEAISLFSQYQLISPMKMEIRKILEHEESYIYKNAEIVHAAKTILAYYSEARTDMDRYLT